VTHRIALLVHFIAAQPDGNPAMIVNHPMLVDAMPEALRLGLVENPTLHRVVPLDAYWLQLTPLGRRVADEMIAAGSAAMGGESSV